MKKTITIVGGHIIGGQLGGPTTNISEFTRILKNNFRINVISPNSNYTNQIIRDGDLTIYLESNRLLMPFFIAYRLFKLISESDVIHFHSPKTALLGLFIRDKPVVLTLHGYYSKEAMKFDNILLNILISTFFKWIEYISIKRADSIIVVGKGISNYLVDEYNISPQKISFIPNGIDSDAIELSCKKNYNMSNLLREELNLKNKKVLLFIKSFEKYNGIIELINSMPIVLKNHPNAHLIAIGGGKLKNDIVILCKRLNIESNVTIIDQIPYDSVPIYLNIANIFIVPFIPPYISGNQVAGVGDTLGIVHLEAMAAKVPVIGTAIGNIAKLEFEIDNALKYVKPGDITELAEMIIYLLNSPQLSEDIGKMGKKIVFQKYDIRKLSQDISNVYYSLIK